jgi:hypothetical protein
METAKEILGNLVYKPHLQSWYSTVLKAMEQYADQFKYDYSMQCKCHSRTGQTWCCNQCGLPVTDTASKQTTQE